MLHFRKFISCILFVFFTTMVFGQPKTHTLTLNIEGIISNIYLVDLDNNPHTDLLVFHHVKGAEPNHNQRFISLFPDFFLNKSIQAAETIEVNDREILFDIDKCEGKPLELFFLREDGLYSMQICRDSLEEKSSRMIQTQSLLPSYDPIALPEWPLIQDLDEDGIYEIFIPCPNHLEIYKQFTKNEWSLYQRLQYSPSCHFSNEDPLTFSIEIPDIRLADFNADGIKDIFCIKPLTLDVFLQDSTQKTKSLLLTPDYRFSFEFETGPALPGTSLSPDHTGLLLQDLNGDNYVDLVLPKSPKANLFHAISQLHVYYNHNGKYPAKPDFLFTATNIHGEFAIHDFNFDGRPDIAMLDFDLGIWEALQFLLTRKIKNNFHFYFLDKDRTYKYKPDQTLSFYNRLVLNTITETTLHCFNFNGDFNNDGIDDLILSVASDKLVVYPGKKQGGFEKSRSLQIDVPVSSHYLLIDNDSQHSDILFWYPDNREMSRQISWIAF